MNTLSEAFNVAPVEVITTTNESVMVVGDESEDVDFAYARQRTYELAEKGHEALNVAMKVVREAESPAAITALSALIKTMSDVNKNLLVLNKDKAEAKSAKAGKGGATHVGTAVQNQHNIFVGSSKDLNKFLKEQQSGDNA